MIPSLGKHYTATRTGIGMSLKGCLQLLSQKTFGRELCMTAPSLWEHVYKVFEELKEQGYFIETPKRRRNEAL